MSLKEQINAHKISLSSLHFMCNVMLYFYGVNTSDKKSLNRVTKVIYSTSLHSEEGWSKVILMEHSCN